MKQASERDSGESVEASSAAKDSIEQSYKKLNKVCRIPAEKLDVLKNKLHVDHITLAKNMDALIRFFRFQSLYNAAHKYNMLCGGSSGGAELDVSTLVVLVGDVQGLNIQPKKLLYYLTFSVLAGKIALFEHLMTGIDLSVKFFDFIRGLELGVLSDSLQSIVDGDPDATLLQLVFQAACVGGSVEMIDHIVSRYDVNPHDTDRRGNDALDYVSIFGNYNAARYFVEYHDMDPRKVKFNDWGKKGWRSVELADRSCRNIKKKSSEIYANILLEADACRMYFKICDLKKRSKLLTDYSGYGLTREMATVITNPNNYGVVFLMVMVLANRNNITFADGNTLGVSFIPYDVWSLIFQQSFDENYSRDQLRFIAVAVIKRIFNSQIKAHVPLLPFMSNDAKELRENVRATNGMLELRCAFFAERSRLQTVRAGDHKAYREFITLWSDRLDYKHVDGYLYSPDVELGLDDSAFDDPSKSKVFSGANDTDIELATYSKSASLQFDPDEVEHDNNEYPGPV